MNVINLGRTVVGVDDPRVLNLGIRGENLVHTWIFDVTKMVEDYGEGTAVLYNKRFGDKLAYPCETERDGNDVIWVLKKDTDLAYKGVGECEIFWFIGEAIAKSVCYRTYVDRDIGPDGPVPDPYVDILVEMRELALQTEQDAEKAEHAVEQIQDLSAEAETLAAGSDATASYDDETGILSLGIPRGDTGNGIQSITKIGTVNHVDTYQILFTDGNSTTFQIQNGFASRIEASEEHGTVTLELF